MNNNEKDKQNINETKKQRKNQKDRILKAGSHTLAHNVEDKQNINETKKKRKNQKIEY